MGASGDLAPLSHLALAVIGEGEVFYKGERLPSAEALRRASIEPMELAGQGRPGSSKRNTSDGSRRRPRLAAR